MIIINLDADTSYLSVIYRDDSTSKQKIHMETGTYKPTRAPTKSDAQYPSFTLDYNIDAASGCFNSTICVTAYTYVAYSKFYCTVTLYNKATGTILSSSPLLANSSTEYRMLFMTENAKYLTVTTLTGYHIFEFNSGMEHYLLVKTLTASNVDYDTYDRLFINEDGTRAYIGAMNGVPGKSAMFFNNDITWTVFATPQPVTPAPNPGSGSNSTGSNSTGSNSTGSGSSGTFLNIQTNKPQD